MVSLEKIIHDGYAAWRKNLNLCLPFVLEIFVIAFLLFIFLTVVISVLLLPALPEVATGLTQQELREMLTRRISENVQMIAFATALFFLISLPVVAFFRAGMIGMARTAHMEGRCTLYNMVEEGRKRWMSMLGAIATILLLCLSGAIFLVPGWKDIPEIVKGAISSKGSTDLALIVLSHPGFIWGSLAWVAYVAILTLIMSLVMYAIVIDGTNAVEGIKRGVSLFLSNKLDVFMMWLLTVSLLISITFVANVLFPVLRELAALLYYLALILFFRPLVVSWWTKFYLELPRETI